MGLLADNVRAFRAYRGWTQAEAIARSGITSLKLIESGTITAPRASTVEALAKLFGCTVSDLWAEKPRRLRGHRHTGRTRRSKATGAAAYQVLAALVDVAGDECAKDGPTKGRT